MDMSAAHPPVKPIVLAMQIGLQLLFAALLGFVVVSALVDARPSTSAIVALSGVTVVIYTLTLFAHAVRDPRRRRIAGVGALALLTLCWAVLVWLTPYAAYLVFPLFFLYLDVLPGIGGALAVALTTLTTVLALGLHSGWSVGGVVGPLVGAGVALLLGGAYHALRREIVEREQLYRDLLATQGRLATTEREAGGLAERERLGRELHDTVAQGLSSIALLLNAVERSAPEHPAIAQVQLARDTALQSLAETRRFIRALTPPALDEQSLGGALRRLAASSWSSPALDVQVRVADAVDLPLPIQSALLRITQSAMANVQQHAAAGHATISLDRTADTVRLLVADDGCGFDAVAPRPVAPDHGFGLRSIRDRVDELGGTMELRSAPGHGTELCVELPVARETARNAEPSTPVTA